MARPFTCLMLLFAACGDAPAVEGDGNDIPRADAGAAPVICGNGVVEAGEACDDGNRFDDDACNNRCQAASCGDGVVAPANEDCDDGNRNQDDGCLNDCRAARCGDGHLRTDRDRNDPAYEACDDGNDNDDDACTSGCVAARCGDGLLRHDLAEGEPGYEACDDGNDNDDDACSNQCRLSGCGDGLLRAGLNPGDPGYEACDDGNQDNEDGCTNSCNIARCGDGLTRRDLQPSEPGYEACDDGNVSDVDACTNGCLAARCGDGIRRQDLAEGAPGYEACDDGNAVDGDRCSNQCEAAACGNGRIEQGERCDDGNANDDDACRNDCTAARCGDGVQRQDLAAGQPGYEACDDGNQTNNDACTNGCVAARCGDGIRRVDLQPSEAGFEVCDDGNNDPADACHGCRSTCATHANCPGEFGRCRVAEGQQRGTCFDLRHHSCQNKEDCAFVDANDDDTDTICENNRCRVDELSDCIDQVPCRTGTECFTVGQGRSCVQPCRNHQSCRLSYTNCNANIGNHCWFNLCGSPAELSAGFQNVNNGRLGGACAGDHDNPQDGRCLELDLGNNAWVGLCFEGGTLTRGAACAWGAERAQDAQQCGGGLVCTGRDANGTMHCRNSCSAPGEHGSVTCQAGTTCMPALDSIDTYGWSCIPDAERCDVLSANACGADGRCTVILAYSRFSHCQDMAPVNERVALGAACQRSNQCPDASLCSNNRCTKLCDADADCVGNQTCSMGQGAAYGLCVSP